MPDGKKYNGNGHDPEDEYGGNIVRLPSLAERERMRKAAQKPPKGPPFLNLPPLTKAMLLVLLAIHVVVSFGIDDATRYDLLRAFGFTPACYTGHLPCAWWTKLVSPFTYMLLHGNWMHIAMNGLMLMAFGAGVERWMGPKRMLVFFVLCSLAGAAAHFALNPFSEEPIIGASGGLSGLFAAVLVMMNKMQEQAGMARNKMLPLVLLWVVITIGSGMMGAPGGGTVAWAAHIGGFLSGFVFLRMMRLV